MDADNDVFHRLEAAVLAWSSELESANSGIADHLGRLKHVAGTMPEAKTAADSLEAALASARERFSTVEAAIRQCNQAARQAVTRVNEVELALNSLRKDVADTRNDPPDFNADDVGNLVDGLRKQFEAKFLDVHTELRLLHEKWDLFERNQSPVTAQDAMSRADEIEAALVAMHKDVSQKLSSMSEVPSTTGAEEIAKQVEVLSGNLDTSLDELRTNLSRISDQCITLEQNQASASQDGINRVASIESVLDTLRAELSLIRETATPPPNLSADSDVLRAHADALRSQLESALEIVRSDFKQLNERFATLERSQSVAVQDNTNRIAKLESALDSLRRDLSAKRETKTPAPPALDSKVLREQADALQQRVETALGELHSELQKTKAKSDALESAQASLEPQMKSVRAEMEQGLSDLHAAVEQALSQAHDDMQRLALLVDDAAKKNIPEPQYAPEDEKGAEEAIAELKAALQDGFAAVPPLAARVDDVQRIVMVEQDRTGLIEQELRQIRGALAKLPMTDQLGELREQIKQLESRLTRENTPAKSSTALGPLDESTTYSLSTTDHESSPSVLAITENLRFRESGLSGFHADGRRKRMGEILVDAGALTAEDLANALQAQREQPHRRLGAVIIELGLVTDVMIAEVLASQLRLPLLRIEGDLSDEAVVKMVSARLARHHCCIPVSMTEETLTLAMANPLDLIAIEDVELATGKRVEPVVAGETDILDALARYYPHV